MLHEALDLARDNNKILHGMRRSARWGTAFRVLYWFVILGGLAISWYYVQPYLETLLKAYTQVQSQIDSFKNFAR